MAPSIARFIAFLETVPSLDISFAHLARPWLQVLGPILSAATTNFLVQRLMHFPNFKTKNALLPPFASTLYSTSHFILIVFRLNSRHVALQPFCAYLYRILIVAYFRSSRTKTSQRAGGTRETTRCPLWWFCIACPWTFTPCTRRKLFQTLKWSGGNWDRRPSKPPFLLDVGRGRGWGSRHWTSHPSI